MTPQPAPFNIHTLQCGLAGASTYAKLDPPNVDAAVELAGWPPSPASRRENLSLTTLRSISFMLANAAPPERSLLESQRARFGSGSCCSSPAAAPPPSASCR